MESIQFLVCVSAAVFQSGSHRSWYIDPGSGALLLQMLLAGVVGVLFWVGRPLRWIKDRMKRKRKDP